MSDTTLRELLDDLRRDPSVQAEFEQDPSGFLAARGHDLPDDLVAEAIVNVAADLPADVAEHLSSFTIADSPIPDLDPVGFGAEHDGDALDALRALAAAPLAAADVAIDSLGAEAVVDGFGTGAGDEVASNAAVGLDDDPGTDDIEVDLDPAVGPGDTGVDGDGGIDGWSIDDGLDHDGTHGLEGTDPSGHDADTVELRDPIEPEATLDAGDPADLDGLE